MADCAILAIAATTRTVHRLFQRLVKDTGLDEEAPFVPWTIVNKYYTAEVKFLVHTLPSWVPNEDELLAPALLFVWSKGEPYRDQIRQLFQYTSQHEFEVALAVRIPPADPSLPAEVEDDQDVDTYLSSEGFEFVDVPDRDASSPNRTDIAGIPRIVDALSTIMWPSMVRHASKGTTGICAMQGSRGLSSDYYHDLVRLIGEKTSGNGGDRMQRELEELERWLDRDTFSGDREDEGVPWSTAVTPGTLSPSLSGFLECSRPSTPQAGFDDDFTSFVSGASADAASVSSESLPSPPRAPPLVSMSFSSTFSFNAASGGSTPIFEDHIGFDGANLAPGVSYKPLGSMSDFGDPERGNIDRLSDSSDEDGEGMPSRLEIAETSRKIFNGMPLSLSPMQERDEQTEAILGARALQGYLGEEVDVEMRDADPEHFDLQNMLSALQGLKEEISGMPDKERRKTAARVALSLAYSLGGSSLASEANQETV